MLHRALHLSTDVRWAEVPSRPSLTPKPRNPHVEAHFHVCYICYIAINSLPFRPGLCSIVKEPRVIGGDEPHSTKAPPFIPPPSVKSGGKIGGERASTASVISSLIVKGVLYNMKTCLGSMSSGTRRLRSTSVCMVLTTPTFRMPQQSHRRGRESQQRQSDSVRHGNRRPQDGGCVRDDR